MIGKVILTGGDKCPTCGKVFTAEPPLKPNTEDREFYGGRIKFFKDVACDCRARYRLCIERKYNSMTSNEELKVLNMIVLQEGTPLEVLKKQEMDRLQAEAEAKAIELVSEAAENRERFPHLAEREEIKKQTVLATIIDKDEKIKTLCAFTSKELQVMCKRRKLKFNKRDTKIKLAETLLAYDPSLVVANPED